MDPVDTSVLDHPLLSRRYFFPRREPLPGAFNVPVPGATLACWLHAPHPQAPLLVHFHGNGEIVADYLGPPVDAFSALGLNLLLAEYRGYGASTGAPLLGAMLDDVEPLLRALPANPARMILFGRSVGSIFAIRGAALFPELAGLILESGIAAPLERFLLRVYPDELGVTRRELEAAVAARMDHQAALAAFHHPTLVLHARHDSLVPVENGLRLHAWAGGPRRLVVFDNGDHNSIMACNWKEYLDEVGRFVRGL